MTAEQQSTLCGAEDALAAPDAMNWFSWRCAQMTASLSPSRRAAGLRGELAAPSAHLHQGAVDGSAAICRPRPDRHSTLSDGAVTAR